LSADGTIKLTGVKIEAKGGGSIVKLEGAGASVSGPKVDVGGGGLVNVSASVVKIN
jgi:hypothetical protein